MRVDTIYEVKDIIAVRAIFTKWGKVPLAELFNIGVHVGLRFGDLSQVTFADIDKKWLRVTEQKTGKARAPIKVTQVVKDSVSILKAWYAENYPNREITYLFQSMSKSVKVVKPISTSYFNRQLKEACMVVGLEGLYGSHTLRKSFGYAHFTQHKSLPRLMIIFGHSSEAMTAKYIGTLQQQIDEDYEALDLTVLPA